jgi:hypothetical protein
LALKVQTEMAPRKSTLATPHRVTAFRMGLSYLSPKFPQVWFFLETQRSIASVYADCETALLHREALWEAIKNPARGGMLVHG